MAVLNFPTSRKMWFSNIAAKKAYGIGRVYPTAWTNLFSAWDWAGWIKPQIDYAAGIGCNGMRLLGSIGGVHAATYSQNTYNSHWQQFIEYCGSLGMSVHVACGWPPMLASGATTNYDTGDGAGMTDQNIADSVLALISACSAYTNITGFDILQEIESWSAETITSNWDTHVNNIYSLIKPNTSRLVSFSSASTPLTGATLRTTLALISGSLDWLEFHIYPELVGYTMSTPMVLSDLDYWLTTYGSKDILFGEIGVSENRTYDEIASTFACVGNIVNQGGPRVRGMNQWAALDGNDVATDMWGLYSNTGTPRIARVNLMKQFTGGCIATRN